MPHSQSDELAWGDAEQILAHALGGSQIATAMTDASGDLIWVNIAMCELMGRDEQDLLAGSWRDITHPQDVASDEALVAEIAEGKRESYRLRKRFCKPDGSEVPATLTVTCLRDARGEVEAFIGQVVSLAEELSLHQELVRSWERFAAAVEIGIDPMVLCDIVRDSEGKIHDFRISAASKAVESFVGRPRAAVIGGPLDLVFPGYRQSGWWATLTQVAESHESVYVPLIKSDSLFDEKGRWLEYQAMHINGSLALSWRDITAAYEGTQLEVRRANEQYRLMIDNTGDVVFHTTKGVVKWVSPSSYQVLGWAPEQLIGHTTAQFWHPEDALAAVRLRDATYAGRTGEATLRWRKPDGSYVWLEVVLRPVHEDDGSVGAVGMLRDVNERVLIQHELDRVLGHDPLTGLASRSMFVEDIKRRLGVTNGSRNRLALISVGIDRLSLVNDAYGHAAGDHVLASVASKLVAAVGDSRSVARGSGVDFLVLVPALVDVIEARALADRLRDAVRGPITVGGHRVDVTASLGVALSREGQNADELVQAASLATRLAKESGRDRVCFDDPGLAATAQRQAELLEEARDALAEDRFQAWFMPIVDLRDGKVVGYEALARWVRPDGRHVEPSEFIPVLESTHLASELDFSIMRQALGALQRLPPPLFMAVNVSASTLGTNGGPERLVDLVAGFTGPAHTLHLEITETSLLPAASELANAMCLLSDAGVRWYVDDFGIGFSSISHLRDLPIAGLKLDKSFTAGMARGDETSIRLAQALAGMSQGLELDTVAEGISSQADAAALRAQGWRHGQGWHYGQAVPFEHIGAT